MTRILMILLVALLFAAVDSQTSDAGWLFRNRTPLIVRAVKAQPVRSVIRRAPVRKAVGSVLGIRSCPNGQCPVR